MDASTSSEAADKGALSDLGAALPDGGVFNVGFFFPNLLRILCTSDPCNSANPAPKAAATPILSGETSFFELIALSIICCAVATPPAVPAPLSTREIAPPANLVGRYAINVSKDRKSTRLNSSHH